MDSIQHKNVTVQYKVSRAAVPSASAEVSGKQLFLEISVPEVKLEVLDQEESQHNHMMMGLSESTSQEYINYYDNVLEIKPLKIEEEILQSSHSLIFDENNLQKYPDTIKTESLDNEEVLNVVEERSLHNDVLVTKEPVQCKICQIAIANGDECDSCKKRYKCHVCEADFKRMNYLTRHVQIHHCNEEFECNLCGRIFKHKQYLSRHVKLKHSNNIYKCEFCEAVFKQKYSVTRHLKICRSIGKHKCELCNEVFIEKSKLILHIEKWHSIGEYKCDLCEDAFKQYYYLAEHIKKKHNETNDKYNCNFCGKAFKFGFYLSRHIKRIHSNEQYECHLCKTILKDKYSMTRHLKNCNSMKEGRF